MSDSSDKEQPEPAETLLKCPNKKCGSDNIGQVDLVPGLALISSVSPSGEINWEGTTELDWNAQRPAHKRPRFQCGQCGHVEIGLDRFLVRPDKGKVSKSKARKSKSETA